jgi:hypothetical protein
VHQIACHAATHVATKQGVYCILQGTYRVLYDDRDDKQERLLDEDASWHFIDSPVPERLREKVQVKKSRCHPT